MSDSIGPYEFLSYVGNTYNGERNPEAYGTYLFECLEKYKPDMAKAISETILDPRYSYNADAITAYIYRFWDHDFIFNGG